MSLGLDMAQKKCSTTLRPPYPDGRCPSLKRGSNKEQKTNEDSNGRVEEKGVDFDCVLRGNKDANAEVTDEGSKLVHLTANRAKAPKRRPPSSHYTSGVNTARDVS